MSRNKLRINKDIPTKDQGRRTAINQLNGLSTWEKRSHEAKNDQHPQRTEQIWDPARKIIFRLAREQRQSNEDSQRDDQSLQDNPTLVEGRDHADTVCFECRETREEEHVSRVGLALPKRQEHESNGAE